jgi:hypothetical protein
MATDEHRSTQIRQNPYLLPVLSVFLWVHLWPKGFPLRPERLQHRRDMEPQFAVRLP